MHSYTTNRIGLLLAASMALGAASAAQAEVITWGTAVTQTGNSSDILTDGTLLGAYAETGPITVNGVTFSNAGGNDLYQDGGADYFGPNVPANYSDPNYAALVSYGGLIGGRFQVGGLIIGDEYEIQIFEPNDPGYSTVYTNDQNAMTDLSGAVSTGDMTDNAQYIVGTFIADQTNDSIYAFNASTLQYTPAPAGIAQLRDLGAPGAAPEPGTMALSGLAFGAIALARRRMSRGR